MFSAPVDPRYPATSYFTEQHRRHEWSVDPDNGLWIPIRDPAGFGNHKGVDFACPIGTVVHAMADGMIVRARYESALNPQQGAGLYILQIIQTEGFDSWTLKYTHLASRCVQPGQMVKRYQVIGESGETGGIQFPYLHIELMDLRLQWRPIPIES